MGKFLTLLPLLFPTLMCGPVMAVTLIVTVLLARKQTKTVDGWEIVMLVDQRDI
jgi:hypothetical protein